MENTICGERINLQQCSTGFLFLLGLFQQFASALLLTQQTYQTRGNMHICQIIVSILYQVNFLPTSLLYLDITNALKKKHTDEEQLQEVTIKTT